MWAWSIAAALVGISLGLYFGRLMAAVILHWESSGTAVKTWMAVVAFVFGAGAVGSTALFGVISSLDHGAFYLGGWAVGAIFSYFQPRLPTFAQLQPRLPPDYTLESVQNVVRMSEELRDDISDAEKRALLIAATLIPPKSIERREHINEQELARALEDATDATQVTKGDEE